MENEQLNVFEKKTKTKQTYAKKSGDEEYSACEGEHSVKELLRKP